jgi:outer membrane protein assembly factor BamA
MNIWGSGESLQTELEYSIDKNIDSQKSWNTILDFPLTHVQLLSSKKLSSLSVSSLQQDNLQVSIRKLLGKHVLEYGINWRYLLPTENASFTVRKDGGNSLKSSITHTYTNDTRNDPILPTSGSLLKWINVPYPLFTTGIRWSRW